MPLEDTVCDSNYVEYIKKWYEECISYMGKKKCLTWVRLGFEKLGS